MTIVEGVSPFIIGWIDIADSLVPENHELIADNEECEKCFW